MRRLAWSIALVVGISVVVLSLQARRVACAADPILSSPDGFEIAKPEAQPAVWALLFLTEAPTADGLPPVISDEELKIVWRVGGEGEPTFHAEGPRGEIVSPMAGPTPHFGSTWNRPGDEWGTVWLLPSGGCWQLIVERAGRQTTLYLDVLEASDKSAGVPFSRPVAAGW